MTTKSKLPRQPNDKSRSIFERALAQLPPEKRTEFFDTWKSPWKWGEAYLTNKDGSPRRYFQHQKDELDDDWPLIVARCANGTGKTFDSATRVLHFGATTQRQEMIFITPLTGHSGECIRECEYQIKKSPMVRAIMDPGKWVDKQPYYTLRFDGGSTVTFYPADLDGEAFKTRHIEYVIVDEAAKIPPGAWLTIWNRIKPGGRFVLYSFHNGNRSSTYHDIQHNAIPEQDVRAGKRTLKPGDWKLYTWSMEQLPYPWWSQAVKAQKIKLYKGEHTGEYRRLVCGEVGQPTAHAFYVQDFLTSLREIDGYDVYHWSREDFLDCTGTQQILGRVRELVASVHPAWGPAAGERAWLGMDLGYHSDPGELVAACESGDRLRAMFRVELREVEYPTQVMIVAEFDRRLRFSAVGIDTGNNGLGVMQSLKGSDDFRDLPDRQERIIPVGFGNSVVYQVDEDGTPHVQNVKQYATYVINGWLRDFRNDGGRFVIFPKNDLELEDNFTSQTFAVGSRMAVYSKLDDHSVDAWRALAMARETVREGGLRDLSGGWVEGEGVSGAVG